MNTMQDNIEDAIDQKANSSNVYTKTETDTRLNAKADSSNVYTKTEIDTKLNSSADSSNVYTKTEIDTRLNAKADSSDVYTKTETDTRLNEKANSSDVYTKTEIDTKLNTKTETETGTEPSTNNYFKNAGTHNSLYRGNDITNLFYDGTLSQQIAAETFDDIYIGDYIIGQVSGRKYLVADINYRLHCGDTECTTPHVLMIPEKIMGTAQMNDNNSTDVAYTGSEMYKYNLNPFKTIIKNDFETSHILKHRNLFASSADKYETNVAWYDSEIDLMNECMVYGSNIFHNMKHGTYVPENYTIDKSQLSLFRLDKSKIVARNDNNERAMYLLRDVVGMSLFSQVSSYGSASYGLATNSGGVRPAFLIY